MREVHQTIAALAQRCAIRVMDSQIEGKLTAFYKLAQAEALRNSKVQVPTNTMEQEFSNYHRLGYNKGMAEAFERAAAACDCMADGWENNPGNNPMAGYVASSNCAAAIREMAKENGK